jgi:predicted nucleotidyltransferase
VKEASDPPDIPEFPDVLAFVSVLNRHGVRYVVIGGYVAQGFISDYVTHDVDFTPATDRENLDRLSAALSELGARIRTDAVTEGLPFAHDGGSLMRAKMWNLQSALGAFDITFEPAGGGYDHLAPRAHVITVRGVEIPLADLADVVASKRLANRVKDQLVLPRLDQALAERDKAIDAAREGPVPRSPE